VRVCVIPVQALPVCAVVCVTLTVPVVHVVFVNGAGKLGVWPQLILAPLVADKFKIALGGLVDPVTVTLKQQEVLAPQASVARKHTCVVPIGKAAPLAGPAICVTVGVPVVVHEVLADGVPKVTTAVVAPAAAVTFWLDRQFILTTVFGGMVLACTVTLKQQEVLFPQASVARKHTCVVPTGKAEPLTGPEIWVIVGVAVVVHVVLAAGVPKETTAVLAPLAAVTLWLGRQFMLNTDVGGLTPACTVTVKQQEVLVPQVFVARKQTCVVPIGKILPLTGPLICVKVATLEVTQLVEVAVGATKLTVAPVAPTIAVCVIFAGQFIATVDVGGFVAGATVIREVTVELLPHASVARHVRVTV
jgi:hypothetical protein